MKPKFITYLTSKRPYYDKVFWFILIALTVVSIITMYSAGSQLAHKAMLRGGSHLKPLINHSMHLILGLFLAYLVQLIPSKVIRGLSYFALAFSIFCLILTDFTPLGIAENGAKRWLNLGIRFQPSEIAKLSLIVVCANLLAQMKSRPDEAKKKLYWVLGLSAVTLGLILPSNLSTTLLLGSVIFILMFLAHVNWKVLVSIVGIIVVVGISGYFIVEYAFVRPGKEMGGPLGRAVTWVNRIDRKMQASQEESNEIRINDENIQEVYAQLAVARGGKTPFGVGPGQSIERNYLPLAYADYIFAIYVEETGLIGAIFLISLYLTLLFRACTSSSRFEDNAASLMVMGLGLMITLQAFVSMEVAVALGPVTGQPLPLISHGGTGIVLICIYFGIMMAVSREQNELKAMTEQTIKDSQSESSVLMSEDYEFEISNNTEYNNETTIS